MWRKATITRRKSALKSKNRTGLYRRAADFVGISDVDVLCVQHEFGIFGERPAGIFWLSYAK